jgi:ribosomal protein S6
MAVLHLSTQEATIVLGVTRQTLYTWAKRRIIGKVEKANGSIYYVVKFDLTPELIKIMREKKWRF